MSPGGVRVSGSKTSITARTHFPQGPSGWLFLVHTCSKVTGVRGQVDHHSTDLFHLGGLEPAQDPGELVDGGEGGAFYPHGLRAEDILINTATVHEDPSQEELTSHV